MQLTVMLWRPTSRAIERMKPAGAAFAAEYAAMCGLADARGVGDHGDDPTPAAPRSSPGSAARTAFITP